ncbi:hypothetical protein, partial [Streptomyces sp. SBT349]|uniref:hypothetical protein n=1 Tax=Streptomyces sp. SBT349 TaxID=1580539 RepID=UPI00066BA990
HHPAPHHPAPHQPAPRPGARGRTLVVRSLFALFPIFSLGLLAWVPALRVGVLRRRPLDWAVLGLYVSLTTCEVLFLIAVDTDGPNGAYVGLYLLLFLIGATIHSAIADDTPRDRAAPPVPAPRQHGLPGPPGPPSLPGPPATSPRMRQVASELDELGELLRKQEDR